MVQAVHMRVTDAVVRLFRMVWICLWRKIDQSFVCPVDKAEKPLVIDKVFCSNAILILIILQE